MKAASSSPISVTEKVPILGLEDISLRRERDSFSLDVFPGELVFFECSRKFHLPDLVRVFVGLEEPVKGSVQFQGTAWDAMFENEKEASRFSVGCVFSDSDKYESQWLDNLDVDENVLLAQMMNPLYSASELDERLGDLLDHFGLKNLPGRRPVEVSAKESMRAQWIRAFLPKPLKLLILERPTFGVPGNAVEKLMTRVAQVREEGAAVLWIDVGLPEQERAALSPSQYFEELPPALG